MRHVLIYNSMPCKTIYTDLSSLNKNNMAHLKNSDVRYKITRTLHWIISIIFFLLALASDTLMSGVTSAEERVYIYNLHISVGLLFTLLLYIRLIWLLVHREERSEFDFGWQRIAAHLNYFSLYTLMLLLVLTGFCAVMGAGKDLHFFELFTIHYLDFLNNNDIKYYAKESHYYLVKAAYGFLALHFLGAMSHYVKPLLDTLWAKHKNRSLADN